MRACPSCNEECDDDQGYCGACGGRVAVTLAASGKPGVSQGRELGTVRGSYRLLQLLGEGGMGRVYLAEHTRLGRIVAIKILRSDYADNLMAVRRFFDEARAVNRISHENIIEITDFIENPCGDNYYVMEFLKGSALADVQSNEGPLSLQRSLAIAVQVASALAAVHDGGIVHRDLKPGNIFLVERGGRKDFVKVLDFGIAKLIDGGEAISLQRTAAGIIMGTPEYMSPEQAAGKTVDCRTDIYAFGVILYELCTGERPFDASCFGEMLIKHMTVTPERPSSLKNLPHHVPKACEALIMRCLQKDPDERPQDMHEVEAALRSIIEALTSAPTLMLVAPRARARRRSLMASAATASICALCFGGYLALRGDAGGASGSAHAATPAAPVTPAVRLGVEVAFDSAPPGAAVVRVSDGRLLGLTPFAATLERAEQPETVEFRLPGHGTACREVPLTADLRVGLTLAPLAPARVPAAVPRPLAPVTRRARPDVVAREGATLAANRVDEPARAAGETKPRPRLDRGGVMDPFAE